MGRTPRHSLVNREPGAALRVFLDANLQAIAEVFGLGFVPITAARCDLVIPADLLDHPTIPILMDALHSGRLRREIDTLPGYDSAVTGRLIAEVASASMA